jgi:hypothetical protein
MLVCSYESQQKMAVKCKNELLVQCPPSSKKFTAALLSAYCYSIKLIPWYKCLSRTYPSSCGRVFLFHKPEILHIHRNLLNRLPRMKLDDADKHNSPLKFPWISCKLQNSGLNMYTDMLLLYDNTD